VKTQETHIIYSCIVHVTNTSSNKQYINVMRISHSNGIFGKKKLCFIDIKIT